MSNGRNVPSYEQLELIRDGVILPIMLTMVDNSRQEMDYTRSSLKGFYLAAAEALMRRIHDDVVANKRALAANKIKIVEDTQTGDIIRYKYWFHGYEDNFPMIREVLKAEVSKRLGRYTAELFRGHKGM